MTIRPIVGSGLLIQGLFSFSAQSPGCAQITDSYHLRLDVPATFPSHFPKVTELDNKIPRTEDYHINPDGTLCLGSPLRLLCIMSKRPTLLGFASDCLVPYLYAISHKLNRGGALLFGELAHGKPGELQDYSDLFSLKRPDQVQRAIRLLGMKKSLANKQPCPCDCGRRLGECRFNRRIGRFRKLASRSWFRENFNTSG